MKQVLGILLLASIALWAQTKTVVKPALAGSHTVVVSWTQSTSSGVTGNNLYRGTASGAETLYQTFSTPTTTYTDTSVSNGTTYYYRVTAVSAGGESSYSNEVSAAVGTPPNAPVMNTPVVQ